MNELEKDFLKRGVALLKEERELRKALVRSPHYFAADLKLLISHHTQIASMFKEYLELSSWPGLSIYSWDDASQLAELARCCWGQPEFLRSSLRVLEQAFRFGEAPSEMFVQHYDTLMFVEQKPQVFGSILLWNGVDLEPWTLVDEEKLAERREEFFVHPYAEEIKIQRDRHLKFGIEHPHDPKIYLESFKVWAATLS